MFVTFFTVGSLTVIVLFVAIKCSATKFEQDSRTPPQYRVRYDPDVIIYPDNVDYRNNYPNIYHQHANRDPQLHDFGVGTVHQHHNNEQDVRVGSDTAESGVVTNPDSYSPYENVSRIPVDFVSQFNTYNVSDLLLNFVEDDYVDSSPLLASRFGEGERSAAITPKRALCMPELQTVRIVETEDPSVLYIPSCTRIERCGGCCDHPLLSCQPTDVEVLNFQVVKTQFFGGSKLRGIGKEIIQVEKHVKCRCGCRIQPQDCNQFQEYRKSECRCACTNTDEEKKCYKDNSTKLWNSDICACQCRDFLQCSTGYKFDIKNCRCIAVSMKRRYIASSHETGKFGYQSEVPHVIPLYISQEKEN